MSTQPAVKPKNLRKTSCALIKLTTEMVMILVDVINLKYIVYMRLL